MRMHTPVVITDDSAVTREARRRHWPVVSCEKEHLYLTGVRQVAPRPQPVMQIAEGSLDQPHAAGWKFVLDWVAKYIHAPLLVAEPGGWAEDLALWAAASRGWPVAAWATPGTALDQTVGSAALLGAAQGLLAVGDGVGQQLRGAPLPETPLLEVETPRAPEMLARHPEVTRVLLVSHGDSPRAAAWLGELEQQSGGRLTVDLATAGRWAEHPRVHHVPDLGAAALAPHTEPMPGWARAEMNHTRDAAYAPSRRPAGLWQLALERWFEARDDHYDVVVLTGAPFEFFGFAAWARRRWYARTVLDYPVPFSRAPDPALAPDEVEDARYHERGWNLAADVISAPSAEVAQHMVGTGPGCRIEVVPGSDALADLCLELSDRRG